MIKLRPQFHDLPIKLIWLDNVAEFNSSTFNEYCMSVGISVEPPIAHIHTQNGLEKSFIKRLQIIACTLLIRAKLPTSVWGHVILHAKNIIRIRPSSYHK